MTDPQDKADDQEINVDSERDDKAEASDLPREIGGQKGPEPTRVGDWEKNGRCTDF